MKATNYIKWLWAASEGAKTGIAAGSVIGTVRIAANFVFIWSSKTLVDIATGHSDAGLYMHMAILAGCMALQIALSAAGTRISASTEIRMKNRLRHMLFTRIMESRWAGREAMHTGDMLSRLEGDVRTVSDAVCKTIPATMVTSLQLAAAIVILARLDWRLALCTVAIMPAALLISRSRLKTMRRLTREIRETDSRVQSHLQENIQHRTLISAMERVPEITGTLSDMQDDLQRQVLHRTGYAAFSKTIVQTGFAAGYLTVFLWSIFGLKDGSITFGMMTAFLQLVSQIQRPVVDMSRLLPSFIHASASIDRLKELHSLPSEEKGSPIMLKGRAGIRLEKVSFAYPDGGRTVIEDFTHDFTPGSITAVTGTTGAGKSTLIRLILALILPDSGKIEFYSNSGSVPASPRTRCNIVYVPQGNTLISGTVRSNLLLGNPEATEEEMKKALHTAAADFVLLLPDGLDTVCGETGTGMSEGQAQRIAIARGLLKTGGIILLDEPTSALDPDTERTLLKRLSEEESGKTIIIVSHSPSVTACCPSRVHLNRH